MPLAPLLTSLPFDFADAVQQVAMLGFTHVDVVAVTDRAAADRDALAAAGLLVSCAALGRALPAGCALDAADVGARQEAVDLVKRQLIDAAQLGAACAYIVPGLDASDAALTRFRDSCEALNNYAQSRMIKLCLEHIPGRALDTVAKTLAWLANTDLALLLDIGHCLISAEDPAEAVRQAGTRLGYIHLDDNDGSGDLHWPLLTGRLTRAMLDSFFAVLKEVNYQSGLCLELSPTNPDPLKALREGKQLVERLLGYH